MIAATAPIGESRPSSSTSTSEANRIVAMVMPETGLLDEPTSPARYADTDTNRKPATIMMIVIGMLTIHWSTMAWYSRERKSVVKGKSGSGGVGVGGRRPLKNKNKTTT